MTPLLKFLTVLGALSLSASAWAQSTDFYQRDGIGAPLRVQVQISVQRMPATGQNVDEQAKLMEDARRMIYESVKSVCALLSSAFNADCRLTNINAGSNMMDRGNMGPAINANGNASYELTLRPAKTHESK